jgi:sugar phosphate isomerase/epimerase
MKSNTYTTTRRQALAAGLALLTRPAQAARVSKMRFGFTSYQWGLDWDIPTMIANCTRARAYACELRTGARYAHGVELTLPAAARAEVRKRFADSPVALVGLASYEKFDWTEPERLSAAVESTKAHLKLSQEVGSQGVRVVPNDYHEGIAAERTIEQIARALNEVGRFAADCGQVVRLENHGPVGTSLITVRKIMDRVTTPGVKVKLNGILPPGEDFASSFQLVKGLLGNTLHCRGLESGTFPYQLQADLLIDMGWDGWWLVEERTPVPDRVQALIGQREAFERLVARSLGR